LILRGIKTVEFRSRATRRIGERFYIYASKKPADGSGLWAVRQADNIVVPREKLPEWMIELARQMKMIPADARLPTGVIVGSAVIERVTVAAAVSAVDGTETPGTGVATMFRWHLVDVQRAKRLRKPTGHAQPVWFRPF
jgi:hypothetical protein